MLTRPSSQVLFSQKDDAFFKKIEEIGKAYTKALRSGQIEYLKNDTPPNDTWDYSKLLEFKSLLDSDPSSILFGSYIGKSPTSKGVYAYNLFAMQPEKEEPYLFVAVVSIDTNSDKFKVDGAFLFTEEAPLKQWWGHTFQFYHGDSIKEIPENYLHFICPPPPFKN